MRDEELMALEIMATGSYERAILGAEFKELGARFAEALLIALPIEREL